MTYYFNLSHETISLIFGLFPVLKIPILNNLDEKNTTKYKLKSSTIITVKTSNIPGLVEFNLSNITGTEVKGKNDKIIDNIELGARKISTANRIGKIKNMLIAPVNCCAS